MSAREGAASDKEDKQPFDASSFILDHIADSHEWHILTKKNGEGVAIYLPVILYSKEKGLNIFSSRKLADGREYKGYKVVEQESDLKGKIVSVNEAGRNRCEESSPGFFNDKNSYRDACRCAYRDVALHFTFPFL